MLAVVIGLWGSNAIGLFESLLGAVTILNVSLLLPVLLYMSMFWSVLGVRKWVLVGLLIGGGVLAV